MSVNFDSAVQNAYNNNYSSSAQGTKDTKEASATTSTGEVKKSGNFGKTIGNAKLSDTAAKYYEQLKKKYSNMDFVLVSEDKKEFAKANASNFANASKMVVLIDEEKLERMATDEEYRKKYEGIISNATSGVSQLKKSLENSGAAVKGYGMQVNDDGTSSFFAVLKKSSTDQKARIEKHAAEKKAEKKAAEKKAAKKAAEEKAEGLREKHRAEKADVRDCFEDDDTVTLTANSIEELIQKIDAFTQDNMMNSVKTEQEMMVGQTIDFKG